MSIFGKFESPMKNGINDNPVSIRMYLKIVLLGPPGSGKGTQAKQLMEELKIAHISTGDLLREAVKAQNDLGRKAKEYMDAGKLVPDDLVIALVREKVETLDGGFILDGFPRTIEQAEKLEEFSSIDAVINIEVDEGVLVERLTKRRSCRNCGSVYHLMFNPPKKEGICDSCGGELYQRSDDTEATVRERLKTYTESTFPLVEYYRSKGKILNIDGGEDIGEVFCSIIKALGPLM